MKVVDASFDRISEDTFRAMAAEGVGGFVQCLVSVESGILKVPPMAYDNLVSAKAAGLGLAGYCALSPNFTGRKVIEMAYSNLERKGSLWAALAFVAVDVELPGLLEKQMADAVGRVEYLYQRPIIYTSWNAWQNYLGNTDALAHLLLWDANWDRAADLNYPRPYGGWRRIVGKQYDGDVYYHGVLVDLDEFDDQIWRKDMPVDDAALQEWLHEKLTHLEQYPDLEAALTIAMQGPLYRLLTDILQYPSLLAALQAALAAVGH